MNLDALKKLLHKNKLTNIDYDRVDLVKEGANSGAHIRLFKSRGGEDNMKLEDILKSLKPEHSALVKETIAKLKGEEPKDNKEPKEGEETEDQEVSEVVKAFKEMQADLAATKKELEEIKKAKEDPKEDPKEKDPEDVIKSSNMDEGTKALLLESIQKSKQNEAVIKAMKDMNAKNAAIAKANECSHLGMKTEELTSLFQGLEGDKGEAVYKALKTASDVVKSSELMKEFGSSAESNLSDKDTAFDKIEKKAQEIMKSNKMSYDDAFSKVMDENPELYNEYINAQ